jgi:hypothetical protein
MAPATGDGTRRWRRAGGAARGSERLGTGLGEAARWQAAMGRATRHGTATRGDGDATASGAAAGRARLGTGLDAATTAMRRASGAAEGRRSGARRAEREAGEGKGTRSSTWRAMNSALFQ